MFDEQKLLADIIDKWGAHGAHADLMRWMLVKIDQLNQAGDLLAAWVDHPESCASMDVDKRGQLCNCGLDRVERTWEEARRD